jgi:hypothetical protein
MIGRGIGNISGLCNKSLARFNLNKIVSLPFKTRNLFKKFPKLRFKTVIDRRSYRCLSELTVTFKSLRRYENAAVMCNTFFFATTKGRFFTLIHS